MVCRSNGLLHHSSSLKGSSLFGSSVYAKVTKDDIVLSSVLGHGPHHNDNSSDTNSYTVFEEPSKLFPFGVKEEEPLDEDFVGCGKSNLHSIIGWCCAGGQFWGRLTIVGCFRFKWRRGGEGAVCGAAQAEGGQPAGHVPRDAAEDRPEQREPQPLPAALVQRRLGGAL